MKKTIPSFLVLLVLSAFIYGCVSAKYIPPTQNNETQNYSRIVNKSFDDTWKAFIDYAASTFFSIENFEKESGLMTLAFGSSNPALYVTGGQWDMTAGNERFSGDYVDYLARYANGKLVGKMNIVITKVNDNQTRVTVKARYIFSSAHPSQYGTLTNTWSFDSGNCETIRIANAAQGTGPTRTMCPTYKAENDVIKALESL